MSMDISDFYQTFFDEADELLADMEQHLLDLVPEAPDSEQLNAIFRAAHSIKGGAGTFGFTILQETTHLMENLLDEARRGEMQLNTDIINLFLETKDIMQEQLDAYKSSQEPDAASFEYICNALRQLALEAKGEVPSAAAGGAKLTVVDNAQAVADTASAAAPAAANDGKLRIVLSRLKEGEVNLLEDELKNLATLSDVVKGADSLSATLEGGVSEDDLVAVLCFVIEPDQISFTDAPAAAAVTEAAPAAPTPVAQPVVAAPVAASAPREQPAARQERAEKPARVSESTSIRVAVEKVDQLINLVGELVITQAMIEQRSSGLDPMLHQRLMQSVSQLTRNTRDLQEAVMSIRMMPMDFVFSRFPRMVRDLAGKLGKKVDFITNGAATELDKGLIERIVDPLTHLVRNSIDHGIEMPAARVAAGKSESGRLFLSAAHQGGNIVIEVADDGGGLNREKILAKARDNGLAVSDTMTDAEVWQLIFAPGFSTADIVTDVSGRGVGMDVVKRNIQALGGSIDIRSARGFGTTILISLPLTLAILDGMSIRCGDEIYILPLGFVVESLQPARADVKEISGQGRVVKVRGEYLPLIPLYQMFNIEPRITDPAEGILVILETEGRKAALFIDELVGQQQVVVKNLESNYRKVTGISGATILGDGGVALILDVAALLRSSRQLTDDPIVL